MKEMFCCGTSQRTPYCSMCGKKLQAYPLSDLLNHCREQSEKADEKFKKLLVRFTAACVYRDDAPGQELCARLGIEVPRGSTPRSLSGDQRKEFAKARDEAVKWHGYATALARLMRHAATLPPEAQDGAPGGSPSDAPSDGRNLEI